MKKLSFVLILSFAAVVAAMADNPGILSIFGTTTNRSQLLWVDGNTGNDANSGSVGAPLKTLARAKVVGVGKTVMVLPGVYNANDLLANRVNWHGLEGAILTNRLTHLTNGSGTAYALWDQRTCSGSVTSSIVWDGVIYADLGKSVMVEATGQVFPCNSNMLGAVLVSTNANNEISFRARKVSFTGFHSGLTYAFGIYNAAVCDIHVDELVDPGYGTQVLIGHDQDNDVDVNNDSSTLGVWWENGNTIYTGNNVVMNQCAYYAAHQTNDSATRFDFKLSGIAKSKKNITCYVASTANGGTNHNWTTWTEANEITCEGNASGWALYSEGKHYAKAMKVASASGPAIEVGGGPAWNLMEVWYDFQKAQGNSPITFASGCTNVRSIGNIGEIASSGSLSGLFTHGNGTNYLDVLKMPAGLGYTKTGGELHFNERKLSTGLETSIGIYFMTNAVAGWPAAAPYNGASFLGASNHVLYLLTSTPTSKAWAATNKIGP